MPGPRWITLDELEERHVEWRELAAASEFPTAFTDPRWILPWWKHYGEGYEPWSLAIEDRAGSLRGLAMLARRRSALSRTLTVAGDRWNGLDTVLSASGAESELVASVMAALSERRREWDMWRILRLPTTSSLARSLLSGTGKLHVAAHDLRFQPFVELPGEADAFESRFSGRRRTEFRRRWRRLVDLGAQPHLVTDPDEARVAVASLLELRRSRAIAMNQSHAHMDARFEGFIADAVCGLLPDGARLWTLELDDTILAAKLNFVQAWREHSYISAVSDDHLSLSPGHALERHAIQAMIAEGRSEFDFGAGRDEYKYGWGATDRELARIVVVSPSARGRLVGTPAAIDLRLRNTAAAEALRRRRGVTPERATSSRPAQDGRRDPAATQPTAR
jgi:CelD/BcsL family acetyltransferase involved in cellulose biosynthesis